MYFSKFPLFLARVGNEQVPMTDIFARVAPTRNYVQERAMLMPYSVPEGERIETLAYDLYGSAEYHWIIILVNNIVDPRNEWPLSSDDLFQSVTLTYGDPYETHHYELDGTQVVVNPDAAEEGALVVAVSYWEWAQRENEKKRSILILDPRYLNDFVTNFDQQMNA